VLRPIRQLAIALLAVLLIARPAAAAPPTADEKAKAREHYQKGLVHYDIKEFSEALAEFKNAYRVVQDPAFLFNIAQCYRKLGQDVEALDYYRNYARRFPNAPNRGEVDRRIQEIERELDAKRESNAPPTPEKKPDTRPINNNGSSVTPISPPPPNGSTTIGSAPPPLRPSGDSSQTLVTTTKTGSTTGGPSNASPFYTRWWFWTGVGAVIVTGVVVGALATRGQVGDCHGVDPCRTVGN
jgi:tetratricopeptide (TPR) repeat protein